jgi:FtsH-binding integral membrane protein
MAEYENRYATAKTRTHEGVVDQGLRSYMMSVYNYMALGVALTGVVAYALFTMAVTGDANQAAQGAGGALALNSGMFLTPLGAALYASPLKWVVMLAPLAFILVISFGLNRLSASATQGVFWLFAAVMGVSLSSIFIVFKMGSIASVFFITAAAFASLSVYGYTTKKDLSGWGTFLFMGLIGVILASLVNIFLQSGALRFAVNVIGVLVFAGLTAYDTQRIKDSYYEVAGHAELMAKSAVMGALSLYLNFINMFMMLLQLFGDRE